MEEPRVFRNLTTGVGGVKPKTLVCSSNMILSGVNGNVIMSGWKDDNPDNERRETTRRNPTSVSQRADRGTSRTGPGTKRTAMLPGQSAGE